jgi:predicted nucleic acid-binding protein
MSQSVFLDTDVMLDYLENRNRDVRDIVAQLLLLHKKAKISLVTSAFNVAELIDKEFEIQFIGWCLRERMSYDETISKLKRDERLLRTISEGCRNNIEKGIQEFIFKNEIGVLSLPQDYQFQELYDLIYKRQLKSQDAVNVATASSRKVTYFLTNDSNIAEKIGDLFDVYKLREQTLRESFRDTVLESVLEAV